jgi:hypothetical protein
MRKYAGAGARGGAKGLNIFKMQNIIKKVMTKRTTTKMRIYFFMLYKSFYKTNQNMMQMRARARARF